MKKIEIIVRVEKLDIVKNVLDSNGINGMNFVNIMGYGRQNGTIKSQSGKEYNINYLPKVKIETIVNDDVVDKVVDSIIEEVNTGHYGDGKIAIYNIEDYIRIRTGERGEEAL